MNYWKQIGIASGLIFVGVLASMGVRWAQSQLFLWKAEEISEDTSIRASTRVDQLVVLYSEYYGIRPAAALKEVQADLGQGSAESLTDSLQKLVDTLQRKLDMAIASEEALLAARSETARAAASVA